MTASLLSMIGRISSLPLPNYNKERKRKEKDKTQKISFSYKIYLMNWQRGKWVSRFYFIRPTLKSAKPKTHKYFSILMHWFTRVCHLKNIFFKFSPDYQKMTFLMTVVKLAVLRMCPLPWVAKYRFSKNADGSHLTAIQGGLIVVFKINGIKLTTNLTKSFC